MFLQETFLTTLTQIDTNDMEHVGRIRIDTGGLWYKYVKLLTTASQAAVAGDIVCYKTATGYAQSLVSHDQSADADAVPIGAGVLLAAVTAAQSTAGVFLWIQIKGLCTLSINVVSAAAGKMFNCSTTDKTGTVGADDFSMPMGVSLDGLKQAYLDCPV